MPDPSQVAISCGQTRYPSSPPFSPSEPFPEYPFGNSLERAEPNNAYQAVRQALRLLDLDAARSDTAAWNPLGAIVRPGDTVVLKPNFVRDFRETHPDHGDCLITHGSIIRAVADYVFIALQGSGRIIIADAPQNDADFAAIRRIAGLDEIQDFYRKHADFNLDVYDLRPERARKTDGVIVGHSPLPGDPCGYVKVNLGQHSAFAEINDLCHLLYGAEYDTGELRSHHRADVHEYLISKTVLNADVVINLPKLKTHKKVGLTASMKNLVGINGNKNWLPHHREGTPVQGGDQFPRDDLKYRVERTTVANFKRVFPRLGPLRGWLAGPIKAVGKRVFGDTNNGTVRSGNWHGNDTTWRMAVDLNRILLYADSAGMIMEQPARRVFSLVDAIIAGEGNGPLDSTPKPTGVVLAGANPVVVDLACARLMDFDWHSIPLLARAADSHQLPVTDTLYPGITCASNCEAWTGPLHRAQPTLSAFRAPVGWRDIMESPVQSDHPPQTSSGVARG